MEDTQKNDETLNDDASEESNVPPKEAADAEGSAPPANLERAPVVETAPAQSSGETVVLTTEAFNELMNRLSRSEADVSALMSIQSKNDLNKIDEMRKAGKLVKSVKIRRVPTEDGPKYVIGWKTLQDEVFMSPEGRLIERQQVEIFFNDKTSKELTMRQWATLPEYMPFEVTRESKDGDGSTFFTVRNDEGQEFEINSIYVN